MDSFSYRDSVRAVFSSCSSCFGSAPSSNSSSQTPKVSNHRANSAASNDLERLLRDTDSDALSLHSNLGSSSNSRRARQRKRPKFSLTLFGYTLFGRPPIYLSDDEDDGHNRNRTLATVSSSTLDSDAAPLDPSAIERLTSPDHLEAAQRELETRRREVEEQARRKAERRARREERRTRERASALMALTGGRLPEDAEFGGFQSSGAIISPLARGSNGVDMIHTADSNSGDADDADLGAELYVRRKSHSGVRSGSSADSKSRTSASMSTGDASHTQGNVLHIHQPGPYLPTEMQLPTFPKKKSRRSSRRGSVFSSSTASQSTSNTPYTPPTQIDGALGAPPVSAFPIPHERDASYGHNRARNGQEFPSVGLSGGRRPKAKDIGAFLSDMNGA